MQQKSEDNTAYKQKLRDRITNKQYRNLQPVASAGEKHLLTIGGQEVINFCSNDYLGLSAHPELIHRSNLFTKHYGTSASASRLVSGSLQIHHDLEAKIAGLFGREAALLFGSGFQANVSLFPALAGRGDVILADKLIHNSILQGCLLSRAEFRRFRHNDLNHLEMLLKRFRKHNHSSVCWVVTESLFSMDGDQAPFDEMGILCKKYGAHFYVDDAHAFGVWGDNGLGFAGSSENIDIILGTLGKAGGGFGAFITCSKMYKEYLINYCNGIIYSTSPPPGVIGAADAAFDLIPRMNQERAVLKNHINLAVEGIKQAGYETGGSRTQILPVLLDSESQALTLANKLKKQGLFVQAIRPPTVTRSRLRVTLTVHHTKDHIKKLTDALLYGRSKD